jgi:hypothetical protein
LHLSAQGFDPGFEGEDGSDRCPDPSDTFDDCPESASRDSTLGESEFRLGCCPGEN